MQRRPKGETLKETRKFGDKKFKLMRGAYGHKVDAKKAADRMRKAGIQARVVAISDVGGRAYVLYKHR